MKATRKIFAGLSAAAIALSCMSIASFAAPALNSFEATADNVKILGRAKYMEDAGALWFGLTDAGLEYTFTGTTTSLNVEADKQATGGQNPARIKIFADDQLYLDTVTTESPADYTVTFDDSAVHTVKLIKVSEAENGSVRVNEIKADADSIAPAAAKAKKIEFVGDSITCGYGVDGTGSGFSTKTEDGSKTYAYKAAQKLGADYSMVSYSGFGIISGYTTDGVRNTVSTIKPYYDKLGMSWGGNSFGSDNTALSDTPWDAAAFEPDLIVVNLGTNDASYISSVKGADNKEAERNAFAEEYANFIATLRAAHPDAEILCTLGIMGQDLCPKVEEAVNKYTEDTGDTHVKYLKFNQQDTNKNGKGIDWHPAPQSHVDAAHELIDAIKELYGWEEDPDVDIDLPAQSALVAKTDTDMKFTEISAKGTEVTVALEPAAEGDITFTVADSAVADIDTNALANNKVGTIGDEAAASKSLTVTTDASTGEATVYVFAANNGTTTLTAETADGQSVTFNIEVAIDTVSVPDDSSEADSSEAPTSSEETSEADSTASSSSSASSSKSNSNASGKENATTDTNPATGAAAGAATAVVLVALGAIAVSKKSKK